MHFTKFKSNRAARVGSNHKELTWVALVQVRNDRHVLREMGLIRVLGTSEANVGIQRTSDHRSVTGPSIVSLPLPSGCFPPQPPLL